MTAPESFAEMEAPHLQCRSLNHAWDHQQSLIVDADLIELTFRCRRCKCRRRDEWNRRTGEVERRSYAHPEGYLVTNLKQGWGGRRTFNNNVRAELVSRVYVKGAKRRGAKRSR